jgi:hypothetical protein
VGDLDRGTVGEYTTSGDVLNASLISGLDVPESLVVVVPEPSSVSLVVLGLALFALSRRVDRTLPNLHE